MGFQVTSAPPWGLPVAMVTSPHSLSYRAPPTLTYLLSSFWSLSTCHPDALLTCHLTPPSLTAPSTYSLYSCLCIVKKKKKHPLTVANGLSDIKKSVLFSEALCQHDRNGTQNWRRCEGVQMLRPLTPVSRLPQTFTF